MAGIETSKVIQEPQNTSTENSNENPRERNPPGDNRSPRGRRGGARFSGGRGGGMSGGNRYSDGPVRNYIYFFLYTFKKYIFCFYRHFCYKLMRNTYYDWL